MSSPRALYLSEQRSRVRARGAGFITSALALLTVILIAFVPLVTTAIGNIASTDDGVVSSSSQLPVVQQADASGFLAVFCGYQHRVGYGTSKSSWYQFLRHYPSREASNRTWTMNEAFGNGVGYTTYEGEGGADKWFTVDVGTDRGKGVGKWEDNVNKLKEPRYAANCLFSTPGVVLADMGLKAIEVLSSVTQIASVMVFDSQMICKDQTQTGCINILKVIGGTGPKDEGIIGSLTASIYFPMLTLVAITVGLWMLWIGIVKRRYREALVGFAWACCSVIVGGALLLNPVLLAKAPMAINNVIATCVIGAFNGQSCFDNTATNAKPEENNTDICKSTAAGIPIDEQMAMTVNSLNCSIWKAFVLEPYSMGNFGRAYAKLETTDPEIAEWISKAGLTANDFCVNLSSSKSVETMGEVLELDSNSGASVCNIAAYQLALSTNSKASASGNNVYSSSANSNLDPNWFKIALVAAQSETMWSHWALGPGSYYHKIMMVGVGIVSAVLGGLVIMVVAVYALVYLLTSVIMMAFAPLFFLFGVHPGRGKRILLGYFETVVSNIMKYLASAVFLVVTIALYAAILGNIENVGLTLIFVFMITFALLMYRKEIVDLIGRTSMGGQQLSSKFADRVTGIKDRSKNVGTAMLAGAAGGALANGGPGNTFRSMADEFRDDTRGGGIHKKMARAAGAGVKTGAKDMLSGAKAAGHGAQDNARRELRRGSGFVSGAFREADKFSTDNKRDMKSEATQQALAARDKRRELENLDKRIEGRERNMDEFKSQLDRDKPEYEAAQEKDKAGQEAETVVLVKFGEINANFRDLKEVEFKIRDTTDAMRVADAYGDVEAVEELRQHRDVLQTQRTEIKATFSDRDMADFGTQFGRMQTAELNERNLDINEVNKARGMVTSYQETQGKMYVESDRLNDLYQEKQQIQSDYVVSDAHSRALGEAHDKLRPGELLSNGDIQRIRDRADRAAEDKISKMADGKVSDAGIDRPSDYLGEISLGEKARSDLRQGVPMEQGDLFGGSTPLSETKNSDSDSRGDNDGWSSVENDDYNPDEDANQPSLFADASAEAGELPLNLPPLDSSRPISSGSAAAGSRPDSGSAPTAPSTATSSPVSDTMDDALPMFDEEPAEEPVERDPNLGNLFNEGFERGASGRAIPHPLSDKAEENRERQRQADERREAKERERADKRRQAEEHIHERERQRQDKAEERQRRQQRADEIRDMSAAGQGSLFDDQKETGFLGREKDNPLSNKQAEKNIRPRGLPIKPQPKQSPPKKPDLPDQDTLF